MTPYDITSPHCVKNIGEQWVSIMSNEGLTVLWWSALWYILLKKFKHTFSTFNDSISGVFYEDWFWISFEGSFYFVYGLSQWEMMLQCTIVSHWLSPYTEWYMFFRGEPFTPLFPFSERYISFMTRQIACIESYLTRAETKVFMNALLQISSICVIGSCHISGAHLTISSDISLWDHL